MWALQLENTFKNYGNVQALSGVSFGVKQGQRVCLLGPNGAGKSTTIRLFLGLERPDRGSVQVWGSPAGSREAKRRISCTPQETDFPENLSVLEILKLVLAHYPAAAKIDEVVSQFDLDGILTRRAAQLSGGQKRGLALACALGARAEVVFLDEPTVALDVESRARFWRAVDAYVHQGGTVLFTTHYLAEAEAEADHVLVLHQGRVLREGTPREISGGLGVKRVSFRLSSGCVPIETVSQWTQVGARWTFDTEDVEGFLLAHLAMGLNDLEVRSLSLEESFLRLVGRQ